MKKIQIAAATVLVAMTAVVTPKAAGKDIVPPPVPGDLQITDGSTAYLMGHAYGTQNYVCLPASGGVAWTLIGPQATLLDDNGIQMITHFLSPNPDQNGAARATWQHSGDTSAVWAVAVKSSVDAAFVAQDAVPWLLLDVVGQEYGPTLGGKLVRTLHIQRVNTSGGKAPESGCSSSADLGKRSFVPYTADYVFYR